MMDLRKIFEEREAGSDRSAAETQPASGDALPLLHKEGGEGARRMYCPACYEEYLVYGATCPECGAPLEEPLTEDEAAEYLDMLFDTRL